MVLPVDCTPSLQTIVGITAGTGDKKSKSPLFPGAGAVVTNDLRVIIRRCILYYTYIIVIPWFVRLYVGIILEH